MAQQDLDCPEISGCLVNDRRLGPPKGMGPIVLTGQTNSRYPFINKPCILSCAYVGSMVGPAREGVIIQRATPKLEPSEEAGASIIHQLKLNRPAGLLLNDGGSGPNFPIANDVANPDLHQVAATQLAIDCEIEKRTIPDPSMLIKKETHSPNLARLERSLRSNFAPRVPRNSLASGGIKL
jgi:hypothetical protein